MLVARALVHRDRVLLFVIALAAVTDLLTISRSGIIGAAIGVVVVLLVLRPFACAAWRFVGVAVAVVVVLGIGVALRAGVPAGYFSLDQAPQPADHLANRSQLWRAALALWQASPLVGVGAGNYELDLPQVGLTGVRTHANSIYLQSLAEDRRARADRDGRAVRGDDRDARAQRRAAAARRRRARRGGRARVAPDLRRPVLLSEGRVGVLARRRRRGRGDRGAAAVRAPPRRLVRRRRPQP